MKRIVALLLALAALPLQASVDDAHSYALEAAASFVSEGFIVREDYWSGEVKSGQKLMVKHQMFKGNDYAFWLGTANEDCELQIQVLDETGKAVEITPKVENSKYTKTIRFMPQKTGSYSVVFQVTSKTEKSVFWALAYGYR
jgi:hypothetical protein